MKKVLILTLMWGILITASVFAQDTLWTRTYYNADSCYDIGQAVDQTSDGGYIVAGHTKPRTTPDTVDYDIYLVKTDANGDTVWTRTYDEDGGDDEAYDVQQTTDGGYIVAGRTRIPGGPLMAYLLKTDANGNVIWTGSYGLSSHNGAMSVQQTTDGGYIVTGYSAIPGMADDVYLLKTNPGGFMTWQFSYGGNLDDWGLEVQLTTDGNYIIAGWTASFGPGNQGVYLLKINPGGGVIWTRTYGGTGYDAGMSVKQTIDGGYIIAGDSNPFGPELANFYLVKTDAMGIAMWDTTYGGTGSDNAHSVDETADGGYIIAGLSNSFGHGADYDVYVVRANSVGMVDWDTIYGGSDTDNAFDVEQTSDFNYIVAGKTNSFGIATWDSDFYLIKIEGESAFDCDVGMVPDTYPISVAPGGSFGLTGIIGNPTLFPITTDVWVMLGLPGGAQYGPLWLFQNIPLSSWQYISAHLNQAIPGFAPQGTYDYIAYCGVYNTNPNNWVICDQDQFQFTVTTGGGGPVAVGLVVSDYDNAWSEAAQLLLASGEVGSADFVDARNSTPTLNDLQDYDVVLVWSNYTFNNNVALGDVLADYVESGGAVVTANFCHFQSGYQLAGRYMSQYCPVVPSPTGFDSTNMIVDDPGHQIMAGVNSGSELFDYNIGLQGNYHMVQHWDNGYNGATVNTDYPQCVALNNYFGIPARRWTGDVGQMMVNAVLYAASNTIGIWASEPPEELIAYSPRFNGTLENVSRSDGNSSAATEMLGNGLTVPVTHALLTAYPNPFNAQTNITFNVPKTGRVNLKVYNLLGQNVATLVDGKIDAGQHSINWDASNYSSGVYFYKLTAGNNVITKRLTLLK